MAIAASLQELLGYRERAVALMILAPEYDRQMVLHTELDHHSSSDRPSRTRHHQVVHRRFGLSISSANLYTDPASHQAFLIPNILYGSTGVFTKDASACFVPIDSPLV